MFMPICLFIYLWYISFEFVIDLVWWMEETIRLLGLQELLIESMAGDHKTCFKGSSTPNCVFNVKNHLSQCLISLLSSPCFVLGVCHIFTHWKLISYDMLLI